MPEFGDPRSRVNRYAAHPAEHVTHPSVFTTLFPHLGHHKVHEFRWAFIVGLAGVLVLYIAGLITSAILLAAFLVPILYLMYLYEAQVYRDEPATVLGFTIGGGVALGIVVTVVVRVLYHPFQQAGISFGVAGVNVGEVVVIGLALPLLQEVLKPLPALLLPRRVAFPETVDGLVFGIAAGLGFSLSETLIGFSGSIASLPAHADPGNWIYVLATLAVFQPLLQGSTTGVIVAAIWRYRRGRVNLREAGAVATALGAHVAFAAGTQVMADLLVNRLFVLAWQAAIVGAVLVYVRFLLHHSLLEEAAHMGFADTVCPSCHMHIVASGFCPHCGIALSAAPNTVKRQRRPRKDAPPSAAHLQ
jgi:RsiW-degrading membrane proteinase PrsW (M82 family)